tara:strand:- start:16 stop:228 length:213 start_codon:yes stop_codon:yes gene_type:complete
MKTIDLHGVKHRDVLSKLLLCINEWETPFIVITGNSIEMKKEVIDAVGQFDLSAREAIDNPGRMIVYERR